MIKLLYPPTRTSYAVEDSAAPLIRTQLQGGAGRYRRDILNNSKLVSCRWVLTQAKYDYMQAFNRMFERTAEPFLVDLVIGESVLLEHEAHIVPGTFKLTEVRGRVFTVTAQLEIKPLLYTAEGDLLLMDLIDAFGSGYRDMLDRFDVVINHKFPGYLAS